MPPVWLLAFTLTAADVRMEAVTDELTAGSTREPVSGAHTGFLSNHLGAALSFDDRWILGGSYTVSAVEGLTISHTPELDATFLANEHLALTLAVDGTPPTVNAFPFCVKTVLRGTVCVPINETLWSVGTNALAIWDSGGKSSFEWSVDGAYAPVYYALHYERSSNAGSGLSESLWQQRVGLGTTGHLFKVVDLDLRGAYYFYNGANLELLQRGLTQLTGGLPIAPRQWEAAINITAFFLSRKLTARIGFLVAPYAEPCLGSSAQLNAKLSGRVGPVRIWGTVIGQADKPPTDPQTVSVCTAFLGVAPTRALSGYASVGAEYGF